MSKGFRSIIVTGSTRGIGYASAEEFLRAGDCVVVLCRHEEHVRETAETLGEIFGPTNVLGLRCDVRSAEDVKNAARKTEDYFGGIDVLVNNAGIAVWKIVEETSEREWDEVVETNLKGQFLFMREALPLMKSKGGGVVINISSGLGARGAAKYSAYSSSKFGIVGLTESVADETADSGIKVYAVLPGAVGTKLHLDIHPWEDPAKMMQPEYVGKKIFEIAQGKKKTGSSIEIYK